MKKSQIIKTITILIMTVFMLQTLLLTSCDQASSKKDDPEKQDPVNEPDDGTETKTETAALGKWNNDYKSAKKLAAKEKLPLFINFSASDFSPSCKYMKETVFDSDEWKAYSKDKFVLFQADLPMKKSSISKSLAAQNSHLRDEYKIEHNTVFLIVEGEDVRGRLVGERDITPKRFIEQVDAILNPKRLKPLTLRAKNGIRAKVEGDDDFYVPNTTRKFQVKDSGAEPGEWSQDLEASIALAKKTSKPILLNFTDGSDT